MTQEEVVARVTGVFEAAVRAAALDLDQDFYENAPAVEDALTRRSQFNVIHFETGMKVDLIVRKDRPFSQSELERRTSAILGGRSVAFATAEDTFLAKLEWAGLADSERRYDDAFGIARVQGAGFDWAYVERCARDLRIANLVARVHANQSFR